MRPPNSAYNIKENVYPPGDNKLIYEQKTPFQVIRLFKNGKNFWMSLNGMMQFHTGECYLSHKYMCVRPLQILGRYPKNVLVIGGGDGLPTQELLRRIPTFTQVELDRKLIEFTKTHPVMRRISNNSFNNPRVELIAGDGLQYLINSNKKYDIIIDDCDFSISKQPGTNQPGTDDSKKYHKYKKCLISKLTPGGISVFMEPIEWSWPGQQYLSRPKQQQFLRESVEGEIKEWKEFTPYIRSELVELPFIGPELYLYLSNRPII